MLLFIDRCSVQSFRQIPSSDDFSHSIGEGVLCDPDREGTKKSQLFHDNIYKILLFSFFFFLKSEGGGGAHYKKKYVKHFCCNSCYESQNYFGKDNSEFALVKTNLGLKIQKIPQ